MVRGTGGLLAGWEAAMGNVRSTLHSWENTTALLSSTSRAAGVMQGTDGVQATETVVHAAEALVKIIVMDVEHTLFAAADWVWRTRARLSPPCATAQTHSGGWGRSTWRQRMLWAARRRGGVAGGHPAPGGGGAGGGGGQPRGDVVGPVAAPAELPRCATR